MHFSFRIFRRIYLGLVCLLSLTSIVFSVVLLPNLTRKSNVWVLCAIPTVIILCALWSLLRKTLNFRRPQKVAIEVTWTFAAFPFELILALFTLAVAPTSDGPLVKRPFLILVVVTWITTIFVGLYTTFLLTLAILTQLSFDRDVWYKDIDASPSPFPFRVLAAYLIPALRPAPSPLPTVHICPPGCACTEKLARSPSPDSRQAADAFGGAWVIPIRVPTDEERRFSIVIAFDGV